MDTSDSGEAWTFPLFSRFSQARGHLSWSSSSTGPGFTSGSTARPSAPRSRPCPSPPTPTRWTACILQPRVSAHVKLFEVLEVFSLSGISSKSKRPTPALEDIDVFRLLPSTTQYISFIVLSLNSSYLLDVLADPLCLPSLKSLDLDYHVRNDDDHKFVPRARCDVEAINAAARSRGIEIEWDSLDEETLD